MQNIHIVTDQEILAELEVTNGEKVLQQQLIGSVRQAADARFGNLLTNLLDPPQLNEFAKLQETGASDETLYTWLADVLPEYQQLYAATIKDCIAEIKTRLAKA